MEIRDWFQQNPAKLGAHVQLIAAVLAIVGFVLAATNAARRSWNRRIVVRRITQPTDSHGRIDRDLDEAFCLYEKLVPNELVRDSSEDIIRWLREIRAEEDLGTNILRDYLIIAKSQGKVCTFFYGDLHVASGLLLIAYFASERPAATERVGKFLARELRHGLRDCSGIVFELEGPVPGCKEPHLSRFRRFESIAGSAGITLRQLDFPYRQPRLSLSDESFTEQDQLLLYGRANAEPVGQTVGKEEVKKIVDVVYNGWYGSSFEDEPERDGEYRKYLAELFKRTVAALPDEIDALDYKIAYVRSRVPRGRNLADPQK